MEFKAGISMAGLALFLVGDRLITKVALAPNGNQILVIIG
jgi:hypothetical protein